MRVGSLVFATDQGLGILAKSFFDNGVVTDPIVVSYTARGKRPMHLEWYPNAPVLPTLELCPILDKWLDTIDVFLAFETPFIWELFDICKARGVKTVLMPMYECLHERMVKQHKPDLFLCPSLLDEKCVLRNVPGPLETLFLPVPVQVSWRQRTHAEVFVHNAGNGGLKGRNGTKELIEALNYVQSPIKFILRSQVPLNVIPFDEMDSGGNDGTRWGGSGRIGNVHLVYWGGTATQESLYNEGDVFVFPEKFNGLSLPLQEARAAGMLVMGTDRFPMNTWLPKKVELPNDHITVHGNPLIPISDIKRDQRTFPQFMSLDEAVVDPRDIAATIDSWYGKDITEYSLQGKAWAESMSWDVLKPQYMAALENLCASST